VRRTPQFSRWTALKAIVGIDVYLKDEAGVVLGSALDAGMALSRFALSQTARDSRLLRYLDPAGDLVLNRAQATTLLEDLAVVIPNQQGPLRGILEKVREFAEQSERDVHLYLWFVGD
jgi:hypothetical protein